MRRCLSMKTHVLNTRQEQTKSCSIGSITERRMRGQEKGVDKELGKIGEATDTGHSRREACMDRIRQREATLMIFSTKHIITQNGVTCN